jgi:hypothetical protein
MGDPSTGEGVAFTLWRDEAAMRAGEGYQAEEFAHARQTSGSLQISPPKVYQVIAST